MRALTLILAAALASGACSAPGTRTPAAPPSTAAEPPSGLRSVTAPPRLPVPTTQAATTRPAVAADKRPVEALLGDHFFDPQVIVVKVGTTVTWRNSSGTHDVTSRDGSFRSPTLGDSYSYAFTRPGRYPFFCSYHPGEMTGEVVVEPPN